MCPQDSYIKPFPYFVIQRYSQTEVFAKYFEFRVKKAHVIMVYFFTILSYTFLWVIAKVFTIYVQFLYLFIQSLLLRLIISLNKCFTRFFTLIFSSINAVWDADKQVKIFSNLEVYLSDSAVNMLTSGFIPTQRWIICRRFSQKMQISLRISKHIGK